MGKTAGFRWKNVAMGRSGNRCTEKVQQKSIVSVFYSKEKVSAQHTVSLRTIIHGKLTYF